MYFDSPFSDFKLRYIYSVRLAARWCPVIDLPPRHYRSSVRVNDSTMQLLSTIATKERVLLSSCVWFCQGFKCSRATRVIFLFEHRFECPGVKSRFSRVVFLRSFSLITALEIYVKNSACQIKGHRTRTRHNWLLNKFDRRATDWALPVAWPHISFSR